MRKCLIVICVLVLSSDAEEVADPNEGQASVQEPDSSNIQQSSGSNLETGRSFSASISYPPPRPEQGPGYGYIPPQGQFYPAPGPSYQQYPVQPYPYFGGSAGYPNTAGGFHQRPPYYGSNYLQSYDVFYGRRSTAA